MPRRHALLALAALGFLHGCASPAPVAMRDPAYRFSEIRRPAVVLQVALDQTGFGEGEFTSRERAGLPEEFQAGLIEGLNSRGIFPLDVDLVALRAYRDRSDPIERLDRNAALARARNLKADTLLVVGMHVTRRDLLFCRETRRPLLARGTMVAAVTLEVLRVPDGMRLLLEPPDSGLTVTDVEAACTPEQPARRLSPQELTDATTARIVARLMRR